MWPSARWATTQGCLPNLSPFWRQFDREAPRLFPRLGEEQVRQGVQESLTWKEVEALPNEGISVRTPGRISWRDPLLREETSGERAPLHRPGTDQGERVENEELPPLAEKEGEFPKDGQSVIPPPRSRNRLDGGPEESRRSGGIPFSPSREEGDSLKCSGGRK